MTRIDPDPMPTLGDFGRGIITAECVPSTPWWVNALITLGSAFVVAVSLWVLWWMLKGRKG